MEVMIYVGLFLLGAAGLAVLRREGLLAKKEAVFLSMLLMALAMVARGLCMEHKTLDYQNFLTVWVDYFRKNSGWSALKHSIGNYNVPYLYFLALFSYSDIPDLYLIKFLSIFFDLLLAWGVLRLVGLYREGIFSKLAGFFLTLCLPTVILNGAYWGQCDSIYSAFAVWSVYFALSGKPIRSVAAIAAAFAFKLQAIFLMPVFLIFLFTKKIKWWQLGVFPLTYFIIVLPAVLTGRPLWDTVTLYFNQAGSIGGGLNYNSSSIFAFATSETDTALWSKRGILIAFGFLALVYVWFFVKRHEANDRTLLAVCVLICVGVPFLLPHMHDRYFFLADVLSLALAVVLPGLFPVPVLVSFGSLLGYHAYLKMRYLLPMRYGAVALALAMLLCGLYIVFSMEQTDTYRPKH